MLKTVEMDIGVVTHRILSGLEKTIRTFERSFEVNDEIQEGIETH